MSTLGDLLAEHTVLPGNAVDHLHAVVGEWQLRADLPFPYLLLWVRPADGDLLHMLSEATVPNAGDLAMSRSSPRVGDGFIRLDETGGVVFASPNAISAYHRMGLASELEGHNLVTITRPLIGDPFEAQELANHVRDSLAGGSSMPMEVVAGGAAVLVGTLPVVGRRGAVGAAGLVRGLIQCEWR